MYNEKSNKSKLYKYCVVPMCKNSTVSTPDKLFVSLPREEKRNLKWQKAMRREHLLSAKSSFFCCEDHFNLEEDMQNYCELKIMKSVKRIIMKPNVLPHKFECQEEETTELPTKRTFLRTQHTDNILLAKKIRSEEIEDCLINTNISIDENRYEDISTKYASKSAVKSPKVITRPTKNSRSIQCNIKQKERGKKLLSQPHSPHKNSTVDIESSLESNNYSPSNTENVMNRTDLIISNNPKLYLGIPTHSYFLVDLLCQYTELERKEVLITLKKIKLDLPYSALADDFAISLTSACLMLQKSIPRLALFMKELIQWKELSEIPDPYRLRCRKVQAIIDCFEIQIEEPSDPILQYLSWSHYKKCYTLKYLISCTPDGFINFISQGFGGRTTDGLIVQECGFLHLLEPYAHVMAGRGFKNIAHLLHEQNNLLVRPSSVSTNIENSNAEMKDTKRIGALKILIERVISRIKEFTILGANATLDLNMIKYLDDILIIVCGLINIQNDTCRFNNGT